MKKRLLSWLLTAAMTVSMVPTTMPFAFAADKPAARAAESSGVVLDALKQTYQVDNLLDDITINQGGTYKLTGTNAAVSVIVDTEDAVTLLLENLELSNEKSPIQLNANANVTLVLAANSTNTLTSKAADSAEKETVNGMTAGINVPEDATLTIDKVKGETAGELTVQGGYGGAGIGSGAAISGYTDKRGSTGAAGSGGSRGAGGGAGGSTSPGAGSGGGQGGQGGLFGQNAKNAGTVVINAGTLTVTGGENAAGIGGGRGADGETATESGKQGTAGGNAWGSTRFPAGGGGGGSGGNGGNGGNGGTGGSLKALTITGGTVNVTGGKDATGIGGGNGGAGGDGGQGGTGGNGGNGIGNGGRGGNGATGAVGFKGASPGGDGGEVTITGGRVKITGYVAVGAGRTKWPEKLTYNVGHNAGRYGYGGTGGGNNVNTRPEPVADNGSLKIENANVTLKNSIPEDELKLEYPKNPADQVIDGQENVDLTQPNNYVRPTSVVTGETVYNTKLEVFRLDHVTKVPNADVSVAVHPGESQATAYTYRTVADENGVASMWLPKSGQHAGYDPQEGWKVSGTDVSHKAIGRILKDQYAWIPVEENDRNTAKVYIGVDIAVTFSPKDSHVYDKSVDLLIDGTTVPKDMNITKLRWFREKITNNDTEYAEKATTSGTESGKLAFTSGFTDAKLLEKNKASSDKDADHAGTEITMEPEQAQPNGTKPRKWTLPVDQNGRYWVELTYQYPGEDEQTIVKLAQVNNIFKSYPITERGKFVLINDGKPVRTQWFYGGANKYVPLLMNNGMSITTPYGFAWDLDGYNAVNIDQGTMLAENKVQGGYDTVTFHHVNRYLNFYTSQLGNSSVDLSKSTADQGVIANPHTMTLNHDFLINNQYCDVNEGGIKQPNKYTITYAPRDGALNVFFASGQDEDGNQLWDQSYMFSEDMKDFIVTAIDWPNYEVVKGILRNNEGVETDVVANGKFDKNTMGYSLVGADNYTDLTFTYKKATTNVTVKAYYDTAEGEPEREIEGFVPYTVEAAYGKDYTPTPLTINGYECTRNNLTDGKFAVKDPATAGKDEEINVIKFYFKKASGNVTYRAVVKGNTAADDVTVWTKDITVNRGEAPKFEITDGGTQVPPTLKNFVKKANANPTITRKDTGAQATVYDGVYDLYVTYEYEKKTKDVTIKAVDLLKNKEITLGEADAKLNKTTGENHTFTAPDLSEKGYKAVGQTTQSYFVDADTEAPTVTFYYMPTTKAPITVTLVYTDAEGQEQTIHVLRNEVEWNSTTTMQAPNLKGYTIVENQPGVTKTEDKDTGEVKYTLTLNPTRDPDGSNVQGTTAKIKYTKDDPVKIKVELKEKDVADSNLFGKLLNWKDTFEVEKGADATATAPSIPGYKLATMNGNTITKKLTAAEIAGGNTTITFYYEKIGVDDLVKINVKGINEADNNKELYSYQKLVPVGAAVQNIEAFAQPNLKLNKATSKVDDVQANFNPADEAVVSLDGKAANDEINVVFTYGDNTANVTINGYYKDTTDPVFTSFKVKAEVGKAFTYKAPVLVGYSNEGETSKTIDSVAAGNSITFYYSKSTGNVTYKAVDEKGKDLAIKSETIAKDGKIVSTTEKANQLFSIPYYQVKAAGNVTGDANGQYDGQNDVTVTYTYERIKKTVTIEKIDQATGEKIAGVLDQKTEALPTGETHTVTLDTVDGYTSLDGGSVNIFVKNEKNNQVVKVYYKQSTEAFITVKQVCGSVTLNTYQIPAQYDVKTTIKAPVMQGYNAPKDTEFTAEKNKTNEVTLNYTLDAWKVTVKLVDQTNHEITVPGFQKDYQVKKGDSFSIAAPSINDYSLISNDLVATRTATELEQEAKRTITFKYDKTENVDYVTHTIRGVDKDNNDAELFSYTVLVAKDAADADAVATYYAPTWANLTPATLVQTAKKNETKTVTFEYSSNLATVTVEHVGRNGVKLTEGGITDVKLDGYTVTGKATTIAAPALDDYVCVGAYTDSVQEGKLTQDVTLTAGSNTVKFVYEKIVDSDVVFKLVDKDTNHIINYIKGAIGTTYAPAQPNNALNLSSIHYNFVADEHASDAFKPNGNASVTVSNGMKGVYVVYYERQTRTVTYNFKDVTGGETTATDIKNVTHGNETSARIGEKFKATAPVIDGYTVVGSATFNEVVEAGTGDLVITFNYRQKDSKEVTVNHKVTDTNGEVLFTYTMSASVGEWVTAKSHDFGGKYTLTSNAEQKIRVTNGENTIEFFYAPNFVTVSAFTNTDGQNDQSYGTSITAAKKTGGTVKLNPPSMNGFVLSGIKVDDDGSETTYAQGWDKNTNTLTLTLSEQSKDNIRVTYYYKEIKDVIPDYQANLTIKAQYNGVQLIADRTQVVTKGKNATVIPATRDGYTVKQYKLGENGQLTDVQEAEKLNGITVNVSADTTLIFTYDRTDNTVVLPGKDNIIGGGDDIIVKPGKDNPDQKPETDKNGNIKVPDGGTVILPDGTEVTPPGGSVVKPDGSIVVPGTDGSTDTDKGATEIDPTKPNTLPEGWFMVKYDLMGGKGTVPMQFVKPGETVKALDPVEYGITAPTDRSFKTWNDNVNGNGNDRPVGTMFSNAMVTDIANKTLTLFAQWKNDRPVILSVKDGSKVKQVELNHKNENVLTMYGSYTENEEDKTYTIPVLVDGKPAQDNELRWYVEADSYKKFGFTGGLGSDDIVTVNAQTGEIRVKNSGIVRIYCESVADSSIKLSFVLVVPGDINRDGMVNMDDADLCSEHVLDDVELDDFQKLLGKLNWEYPDTPITMDDVDYIGEIALGDKEI